MPSIRKAILDKLFRGVDPYSSWKNHSGKLPDHSYPHTGLPTELVSESLRKLSERKVAIGLIVEVGSFKGGSANLIASVVKQAGVDAVIICIDTFLGDVNMRGDVNGWLDWLALEGGYPTVYDQFMANIIDKGHNDTVIPLATSSTVGLRLLDKFGLKAALAYLDSAHEVDGTYLELKLLSKIMCSSGIILGDDFNWPSVRGDVSQFISDRKLMATIRHGQFYSIDL